MRVLTTILAASVLLLTSCNKFKKTKSGMNYKITSAVSKEKIKQGNAVKFNVELKIAGKDTVLGSTYNEMPLFEVIDTAKLAMQKYSFWELLPLMGKGDKAEFVMSVDTLVKLKAVEYNKDFKKGGTINGKMEILNVYPNQDAAKADYEAEAKKAQEKKNAKMEIERAKMEKETAGETAKEKTAIEKYLADKKFKAIVTASGSYVIVENAGDATAKADSGKMASVYYKGTILSTGEEFDSNIKGGVKGKTLDVAVGIQGTRNSVIKGMDEGLRYFGKGGKGKIIIPFNQAYGPQGSPPVIPAFATLVFDIEMVGVGNYKPEAAPQGQPQPY
jgi:FKBP-type peptidyl-prolyl cis-trans isomerase FkpA